MIHKHYMTWNKERSTEKLEKWEMPTVGLGKWWETWKNMENEKHTLYDLEYVEKTNKWGKWENHGRTWNMERKLKKKTCKNRYTNTVGPGIWRENWQTRKMRNSHVRTWNMARNTDNMKNEKRILLDLEYVEKEWKPWNRKNTQ